MKRTLRIRRSVARGMLAMRRAVAILKGRKWPRRFVRKIRQSGEVPVILSGGRVVAKTPNGFVERRANGTNVLIRRYNKRGWLENEKRTEWVPEKNAPAPSWHQVDTETEFWRGQIKKQTSRSNK